uniref:Cytochrome c oxidase subunit 2 n=1 Tax=Pteroptyx tener TaxID=2035279 RepID=A0A8A4HQ44_9COLE|nr:cytochrome c oxidase subunit II [Pteroptyx tener]QTC08243.1 cytochrome c oxidase subunit 2 [Pteroptyx tener]QTC08256.1 cytochrome c oxidase subunit 2 [Pteroptyx tener]QTC08269.1 cytochrome c oxidase subunit 2 [Pteroptyx tener]QTC08282.1 cytochrome c oxidase subunit 2 [Pteroptyx tener]UYE92346.1 cytochrome c oxidase subunit 2 [Pteroptyx tener]
MATWMNLNSQDSISPLMEQLTFFHDHTMMILIMITLIVMYIMIMMMKNMYINRFLLEGQMIELIWTISPAITLIFIALPSLQLLYLLDEINSPLISVKTMGHQWYWSYELSDFKNVEFDSYMIPSNEQNNFSFRLLEVDNRLTLPIYTQIRMMVSSSDVIHSWTIPSSSVKIDATPGRLNQTTFYMNRIGLFFGQCSEICGTNHSFMPIVVESISPKYFIEWIKNL